MKLHALTWRVDRVWKTYADSSQLSNYVEKFKALKNELTDHTLFGVAHHGKGSSFIG